MMLLEESGLRVPWKVPLPLEKKALLALLMLTVIHLELERLEVHQAPKHLAEWDIGILISRTTTWTLSTSGGRGRCKRNNVIWNNGVTAVYCEPTTPRNWISWAAISDPFQVLQLLHSH